ncbi:MAG: hypothetical protein ABR543_05985 [Gemmatimonadaceae bacterium]
MVIEDQLEMTCEARTFPAQRIRNVQEARSLGEPATSRQLEISTHGRAWGRLDHRVPGGRIDNGALRDRRCGRRLLGARGTGGGCERDETGGHDGGEPVSGERSGDLRFAVVAGNRRPHIERIRTKYMNVNTISEADRRHRT